MSYLYGAHKSLSEDGWYVNFPDFESDAFAYGNTLKEACENAALVLQFIIATCLDSERKLPKSVCLESADVVFSVDVDERFIAEAGAALEHHTKLFEMYEVAIGNDRKCDASH